VLTPKDIQAKEFGKSFRGFDEAEVNDFLNEIIKDYTALLEDNETLRAELARAQKSNEEFHRIEQGMRDTLMAAQKTAKLLKEEGLSAAVVNMRTVKPLDEELLHRMAHEKKMLVTMEENALAGGFGSAVLEALADAGLLVPVVRFGIGDAFIEQGKPQELLEMAGLLPEQMARSILTAWKGARDGEGAA